MRLQYTEQPLAAKPYGHKVSDALRDGFAVLGEEQQCTGSVCSSLKASTFAMSLSC